MAKQLWKPGNMVYPLPAVLVTVRDSAGKDNMITIGWTGTVCTNPAMAYISVRPERYSYNILKETKEFVINLTTKDMVYATDYCGVTSGRDVDKFKETGLTRLEATYVQAPLIVESPVNIECQVVDVIPYGSHDMFVAKVLGVHADEKYLDKNQKFDLSKSLPIVYSHGEYFALGQKLGKFGYSISKEKKGHKKHEDKRKK